MCDECRGLKIGHLHVHSDASRIDGLGPVSRLVKAVADAEMDGMALTDHGTLSNTISFIAAAKVAGVKPVIGMEAYVAVAGQTFHLTLLGDGNRGMNSLIELNNAGQRGDEARPAFPLDLLLKHHEGITVLSGCPASPMQSLDWTDARDIALRIKNVYQERFFAEMMFVSSSHPWDRAHKLARDLRLRPVVTNDVHFPYAEDAPIHQILVNLKAAFSYDSKLLFLATPHDILQRVKVMAPGMVEAVQKGIRNSHRLLHLLETPTWSGEPALPHVKDADAQIRKMCADGMARLLRERPELTAQTARYQERLDYELAIISDMGFGTYFYILTDVVEYARAIGCRVGPGRGSGAGSLTLYLLGVTEIDPIVYGLQFERFLNPKRKEMPDVDMDFDSDGRDAVLAYANERWGGIPVATYARYSQKTLTADLCRYFRVPRPLSEAAGDHGTESEEFNRIARMHPHFAPAYDAMLGQIKQIGQHAGGIIITDVQVPLERTVHGGTVAAWTEGATSELKTIGVVKYDFLGISSLTTLRRLEQQHGRRAPDPVDDAPEFEIFQTGDTIGIFQFSGSDGITEFTKKVAPNKFADLVAINALYRPGALDSGAAENYPAWRLKPRKLHPAIDDILAETYGIICYQEQFMALFARVTSGDLGDADIARKTIVKSKPGNPEWEAKMSQLRSQFFKGAQRLEIPQQVYQLLWAEIITHARYSFNKSHAVAYTRLAWDMAWWKYHHPTDFYAATLSVDPVQAQRYLFDVVGRGIPIVPPHVNKSSKDYESDGAQIYLPLSAVKFLGETGVAAILEARPFTSVEDFMSRVPKRAVPARARLGLWELGAFEGIKGERETLQITPHTILDEREKQAAYLGFTLPTTRMMNAVKLATKQGLTAGVVAEVIDRESKFGPYKVYRLLPHGTFWSRNMTTLKEGDLVKVKTKKDSGKALQIMPLLS